MKRIFLTFVVITLIAAIPGEIQAADVSSYSATAKVKAEIITVITLTKAEDMIFGSLAPSGTDGSCVLSTSGVRTLSNVYSDAGGTTPSAARFDVSGRSLTPFTIVLPESAVVNLGGESGSASMYVTSFKARPESKSEDALIGVVGTDKYFTVGATITVGAAQTVGSYLGDFSVSIAYD